MHRRAMPYDSRQSTLSLKALALTSALVSLYGLYFKTFLLEAMYCAQYCDIILSSNMFMYEPPTKLKLTSVEGI